MRTLGRKVNSCLFFRAALLPIAVNHAAMTAGTLKVHAI